jgi:L-lactate utilization protein LutB
MWVPVSLAVALGGACSDSESKKTVAKSAMLRDQLEAERAVVEAPTRNEAKQMGMTNGDTATIEDVRTFICDKLVADIKAQKDLDERKATSDQMREHRCYEGEAWLAELRKTASQQGMDNAAAASLADARDHVCRKIRQSLEVVKKKRDRELMQTEAKVFDCVL